MSMAHSSTACAFSVLMEPIARATWRLAAPALYVRRKVQRGRQWAWVRRQLGDKQESTWVS